MAPYRSDARVGCVETADGNRRTQPRSERADKGGMSMTVTGWRRLVPLVVVGLGSAGCGSASPPPEAPEDVAPGAGGEATKECRAPGEAAADARETLVLSAAALLEHLTKACRADPASCPERDATRHAQLAAGLEAVLAAHGVHMGSDVAGFSAAANAGDPDLVAARLRAWSALKKWRACGAGAAPSLDVQVRGCGDTTRAARARWIASLMSMAQATHQAAAAEAQVPADPTEAPVRTDAALLAEGLILGARFAGGAPGVDVHLAQLDAWLARAHERPPLVYIANQVRRALDAHHARSECWEVEELLASLSTEPMSRVRVPRTSLSLEVPTSWKGTPGRLAHQNGWGSVMGVTAEAARLDAAAVSGRLRAEGFVRVGDAGTSGAPSLWEWTSPVDSAGSATRIWVAVLEGAHDTALLQAVVSAIEWAPLRARILELLGSARRAPGAGTFPEAGPWWSGGDALPVVGLSGPAWAFRSHVAPSPEVLLAWVDDQGPPEAAPRCRPVGDAQVARAPRRLASGAGCSMVTEAPAVFMGVTHDYAARIVLGGRELAVTAGLKGSDWQRQAGRLDAWVRSLQAASR
jgi:hypothetical protein